MQLNIFKLILVMITHIKCINGDDSTGSLESAQENGAGQQNEVPKNRELPSLQLTQEQLADPRFAAIAQYVKETREAIDNFKKHLNEIISSYDIVAIEKIMADLSIKINDLKKSSSKNKEVIYIELLFFEIKRYHSVCMHIITIHQKLLVTTSIVYQINVGTLNLKHFEYSDKFKTELEEAKNNTIANLDSAKDGLKYIEKDKPLNDFRELSSRISQHIDDKRFYKRAIVIIIVLFGIMLIALPIFARYSAKVKRREADAEV
ncbi:hypothetical protein ENBRE01_3111 [Enteropsectra breve]|nr:hypothetical protein ENBRE01_3111 [Enteropsectra breve]